MDKEDQELEEEMISFYNQSKSLFVEGSALCNTRKLPDASMDKTNNGDSQTVFAIIPFLMEANCPSCELLMGAGNYVYDTATSMFIDRNKENKYECEYPTTIAINSESYPSVPGFELSLLHEMIHLKQERDTKGDLKCFHNYPFNYAEACRLLASCYSPYNGNEEDEEGEEYQAYLSAALTHLHRFIDNHNVRFITYCYYIAQNLIGHEELLARVLDGDFLEGKNRYEKAKGLAKRIYWANHVDPEDVLNSNKIIMPDGSTDFFIQKDKDNVL